MNIDFLFLLTALTLISGLICLVDKLYWEKSRTHTEKLPIVVEYSRSFFPIFLAVVLIRSFVGNIFHVPTGSLEPTVMPNDFLLVTRYNYGVHLPVLNTKILSVGKPQRGDIIVFTWPVNKRVDFIKRVVGLPGDKISYVDDNLFINGNRMQQKLLGYAMDSNRDAQRTWPVKVVEENLFGLKHKIYLCADKANCPLVTPDFYNVTVPPDSYFMLGDNRDDSIDSRMWGFVPEQNLIGKAQMIMFSWSKLTTSWKRIGTRL